MTTGMDDSRLTWPQMPPSGGTAEQGGRPPMSRFATAEEMLAWALWWAEVRGLAVFPCEWSGKRPLVAGGFKAATRRRVHILNWWEGHFPGANIATPTGAPGPNVLDAEGRRKPGGDGWAAYGRLKEAGLLAGAHRLVGTPSDGLHGHLKAEHIDFQAAGGYVLLPPSSVDGYPYALVDERSPTGTALDWEACKRLLRPPQPVRRVWVGRHSGRVDHLPGWLAEQPAGNRNKGLHWAACRAAEAGDTGVLAELVAVAVAAGLDEAEAQRTVASAVRTVSDGQ
jgi:Bifunctional DNA primase/polymerase, N-terminal